MRLAAKSDTLRRGMSRVRFRRITDATPESGLDHKAIKQEAAKVFAKRERTIARHAARAIPYALEMAVIAIAIPALTARFTGWSLIWPGLAVVFGAIILKISRDDYRLRARAWWADQTLQVYHELEDLTHRRDVLERSYRDGEERLRSISDALKTLEGVMRSDTLAVCEASAAKLDGEQLSLNTTVSVDSLRRDLKALCRYVCEILGGTEDGLLRCGLLIEDPKEQATLIPIVVYDPSDPTYKSESKYSATDFSGRLLTHFREQLGQHDWKTHATYVVSDVNEVREGGGPFTQKPIILRDHQKAYLQSIAGTVIYCRDSKEKVVVLGVINIDSKTPGAIEEAAYRALQPYLFPAFRMLASRLLMLRAEPELTTKIWRE